MGGERASTTRQRLAGKICARCHRLLDRTPQLAGERVCDQCAGSRRVYMTFFESHGWIVQFLEPDLKTPIGRIRKFNHADRVTELIGRTPTSMNLEARNMLEHALAGGRGGMYLDLTGEQYRKLKWG
jgi:hypothetical protein